jgi:hypothetical protein
VGAAGGCDWSAIACDFWDILLSEPFEDEHDAQSRPRGRWFSARLPLVSVVYHDSVVAFGRGRINCSDRRAFLRCLLALAPPAYHLTKEGYFRSPGGDREGVRRTWAVLGPLHRLAFPAFVTGHRFLTDDFLVEETRWSNGARVVINQRTDDGFEADDIACRRWDLWPSTRRWSPTTRCATAAKRLRRVLGAWPVRATTSLWPKAPTCCAKSSPCEPCRGATCASRRAF